MQYTSSACGFAVPSLKNLQGENMKAIKDLLKHCMDKNGPKPELDGIFIDGNKLICTDTKQMLILTFKESFKAPHNETTMLFDKLPATFQGSPRPKNFVNILDANMGIIDALGFKLCTPKVDGTRTTKFPNYKHISEPKDKKSFKHTTLDFDGDKNDADLLLFKATILNHSLFDGRFLAKFAQLLKRTRFYFSVSIFQKEADDTQGEGYPLLITLEVKKKYDLDTSLVKIEYIVMPIYLTKEERQVA